MNKMMLVMMAAAICRADVILEDGTKLRVKLEQNLSSAQSRKGQEVELSVSDDVRSGDTVVIAQGARVIGTIMEGSPKRRMGRSGSLDFSIDKVRTVDGRYITLRHAPTREKGKSSFIKTGAVMASIAVFVPMAAPVALLMKGKDIEVARGHVFEVFTDVRYSLKIEEKQKEVAANPAAAADSQMATVMVNSPELGAEITVDGKYMGSAPATLRLAAGSHEFEVAGRGQVWRRTMEIQNGSSLTLNASFDQLLGSTRP